VTRFALSDSERLSALLITSGTAFIAFGALWTYFATGDKAYVAAILAAYLVIWCLLDLRVAALCLVVLGCVIPDDDAGSVHLGFVTFSSLDLMLYLGLALVLLRHRQSLLKGAFSLPILLLLAAATVGAFVGLKNGADISGVNQFYRRFLPILGYFVVKQAFRGRSRELAYWLMTIVGVGSAVMLIGVFTHTRFLQAGTARDYVTTAGVTTSVDRIDGPLLRLITVLLALVLSTELLRMKKAVRFLLIAGFVVLEAYSFTRSSWTPLILVAILVAGVRTGRLRSMAQQIAVLVALASIALGAANAGLMGEFGHSLYARASSVVNPQTVDDTSFTDRSNEDSEATHTIANNPFFGVGIGNGYGVYDATYVPSSGAVVVVAQMFIHNTYLGIWVWLGLLGIVAMAFLAWRILAVAVSLWRNHGPGAVSPLAAALGVLCLGIQSSFQTNLFYAPAITSLVVMLAYIDCWRAEHPTPTPAQREASEREASGQDASGQGTSGQGTSRRESERSVAVYGDSVEVISA